MHNPKILNKILHWRCIEHPCFFMSKLCYCAQKLIYTQEGLWKLVLYIQELKSVTFRTLTEFQQQLYCARSDQFHMMFPRCPYLGFVCHVRLIFWQQTFRSLYCRTEEMFFDALLDILLMQLKPKGHRGRIVHCGGTYSVWSLQFELHSE